jgi:hypothetical protein
MGAMTELSSTEDGAHMPPVLLLCKNPAQGSYSKAGEVVVGEI